MYSFLRIIKAMEKYNDHFIEILDQEILALQNDVKEQIKILKKLEEFSVIIKSLGKNKGALDLLNILNNMVNSLIDEIEENKELIENKFKTFGQLEDNKDFLELLLEQHGSKKKHKK